MFDFEKQPEEKELICKECGAKLANKRYADGKDGLDSYEFFSPVMEVKAGFSMDDEEECIKLKIFIACKRCGEEHCEEDEFLL